jgi:S1-C subfamily serine protease
MRSLRLSSGPYAIFASLILFATPWSSVTSATERVTGTGTGFFITPDGYFLTNYHVIAGSERIRIQSGEALIDAKLVRRDQANDIAVLKVEGHFVCLTIGLSNKVNIGDDVFTIGFPAPDLQGVAPKLTKGNISATSGLKDDPRFFQISIPVQPGNSGGPLIDERGNAVGIVASTLSPSIAISNGFIPQNVNYAVKTTYAVPLIEAIPGVKEKLPTIDISTLRSGSEIRETAAKAVGLVIVYGSSKKEAQTPSQPKTVTPDDEAVSPEGSRAIVEKIKELEDKWQASVITHDARVPEALLSEDYTGVGASGRITDKAFIVSLIANDPSTYEIARNEEIHVKVINRKTAIATGITREKGKDIRHKPFDRTFAYTDTWELREGRWQCINARTRVISRH